MQLPSLFNRSSDEEEETTEADDGLSLKSGPGAPMFEPGPQTRIRRAPVRAIASMTWEGGPEEVFGQVKNISMGGCLIKTESTIETGTIVEMKITVIGSNRRAIVDVRGAIRRKTEADGRTAYGVEFVAVDSREKESLQWLYGQALR